MTRCVPKSCAIPLPWRISTTDRPAHTSPAFDARKGAFPLRLAHRQNPAGHINPHRAVPLGVLLMLDRGNILMLGYQCQAAYCRQRRNPTCCGAINLTGAHQ
jgi:hypothetical protein